MQKTEPNGVPSVWENDSEKNSKEEKQEIELKVKTKEKNNGFYIGIEGRYGDLGALFTLNSEEMIVNITSITVDKKHQKEGWGTNLMKKLIEEAREMFEDHYGDVSDKSISFRGKIISEGGMRLWKKIFGKHNMFFYENKVNPTEHLREGLSYDDIIKDGDFKYIVGSSISNIKNNK